MCGDDGTKGRLTRRQFLGRLGRGGSMLGLAGVAAALVTRWQGRQMVWQIDPFTCTQCGRCATDCVLHPSAVRCVHQFSMCGYCERCFGFFRTSPAAFDTGAENQMCPTGAIARRLIEPPYYEYTIDRELCNGCGKCVKGCEEFGNGALHLQVNQDLCLGCNECAIAVACPANAFVRLPADRPYVLKEEGPDQLRGVERYRNHNV